VGKDGQKRTSLEFRFARVQSLERRDPSEGGYSGSFSEGGNAPADAPVARPRGAAAPAGSGSNADSIDVDDIPF
jgi:single-stranded DNA-binding protein